VTAGKPAAQPADGDRPQTLAELQAALAALPQLPPVERARLAPTLIEAAKTVLALERGAALAEAKADGWTEPGLARELGVHRSKVADAVAAWRRARAGQPGTAAGERSAR